MKNQKKLLFLLGVIVCLSVVLVILVLPRTSTTPPNPHITRHEVKSGDTLSQILTPHNLSGADVMEIARLLRVEAGIRRIRAESDVVKIKRQCDQSPVDRVIIQSGPWRQVEFTKTDNGWKCMPVDIEKDVQIVLRSGEIRDGDSFYSSGLRAGIPDAILMDAYDLLAFEMDFERDMRAGQQFSILYEENHDEDGFVNTGSIIALSFDAGRNRGMVKMYRFTKSNGRASYYDEHGGGAIKSLKRTPINNARITSSFGNRRHPVLGFTRAHRGVDFRAAQGTPIPSAGGGRVVRRGWCNGLGNFIRIRHNASYETVYGHMSRFHPNVKVGTQVRQGQILGYVGSTGVSTGPHLHYEIIRDGRHVNPMTVKLPAIDNLEGKDKTEFLTLRPKIDAAKELMRQNPTMVIFQ